MKFLKYLVAVAAVSGYTVAYADAKNFEGISVNLGAYAVGSSASFSSGGDSLKGMGTSSFAVDLTADYGIVLAPNTVLLLGGSYGLSDPVVAKIAVGTSELNGTLEAGDRMSLFAAPGITVSDKVLAYGKVAYVSTKPGGTGSLGTGTSFKRHSGFGYGGGVRILLNPNLYLNFEAMNNDYGSKDYSDAKWSAEGVLAGLALGYKF
jgi:opacity protein-like surface antigen